MRKKICFIVASPLTFKAFMLKHFEYLSKEFDIYIVANFEGVNDMTFDNVVEVKNIYINRDISLINDLKALYSLYKYYKENQFDSVHSITPKAGLLSALAAKMSGIKNRIHIFTGQVWYTKKGIMRKILIFIDKIISKTNNYILVDGHSQRNFLIENKIVNEKNSKVLGKGSISGVDIIKFNPDFQVKNKVRQEIGIKDDDVVFMFLGRMNIDKGLLELAEAFDFLANENKHAKLLMVGYDEENIEQYYKENVNNIDNVIFYGSTNEPHTILQACDVFCLPSYREGFGTSVIEASLLEKPVICSDTYGLMDTIIENQTGLRHKVKDVNSLLEKMQELTYDKEKRENLGKNGRIYVKENFDADMISLKWLKFYHSILT